MDLWKLLEHILSNQIFFYLREVVIQYTFEL